MKGHSGVWGNEIADQLAKEEITSNNTIDVDTKQLDVLPFRPKWHEFTIEHNVRKFINFTRQSKQQALWITNRETRDFTVADTHKLSPIY